MSTTGCSVKVEHLPQISYPYVAEMEFLKEVRNVNGKAKKKRFKDDRITVPFCFLLKIKEIENNGIITVCFYETGKSSGGGGKNEVLRNKVTEKTFEFGKPGKYYEYIIFFDRVEDLAPGRHRFVVFYNKNLIYEDYVDITKNRISNLLP